MIERRSPFVMDEAKFSTQRIVTYFLLVLFAAVTGIVFWGSDQAERSTVLQTVINFTMLAIGFWLGSSKGAADNRDQLNKMMGPTSPLKTENVNVDANTATVTTDQPLKGPQ